MKWMDKKQSDNSFEAFLAGDKYEYVPLKQKFYDSLCLYCANITSLEDETCKAFPEGIPRKFWRGEADHTVPVEGDGGITFEPQS